MGRDENRESLPGVAFSSSRWLAAAALFVLLASLLWLLRAPLFGGNFHSVIPGAVYRSAQLDPATLEAKIAEHGIRSIVNLRMFDEVGDDREGGGEEALLAEDRNIAYFGVRMSATRLAPRGTLLALLEALEVAERPVLIHCRNGTDRTGWASAIATLVEGVPVDRARDEFSVRHGYLAWVSRSDLPTWIDLYENWLRAEEKEHSGARVREFAQSGYTPYFYDARIESVSFPDSVVANSTHRLVVRVTNESQQPWTFTSTSPAGIHLGLRIQSLDPARNFELELRGDTPARVFAPGESIELSATLPELPTPGRYRITVDLVDESVAWFAQMGSTPLERIVEVTPLPAAPKEPQDPV